MTEKKEQEPWYYVGQVVGVECHPPEWAVGYIYQIEHILDGKGSRVIYIGKKLMTSTNRKKIGVREKKATGTRKTYKVVKKDSGWGDYWGSSKTLQAAREGGKGVWERRILKWCYSKKNMSYEETRYQILHNIMYVPSYNDHIGNWYRRDIDKETHDEYREKQKQKKIVK